MALKERLIGVILIIIGALPFLLKFEPIGDFFTGSVLEILVPGELIYQLVIVILGALLIWKMTRRLESH